DHLPASEGAVARGAGGDVERAVEGKTEAGALGARRRLAPRPAALGVGQAVRTWLAHGGSLPFSLGGQPALGPVAVGLRLVPVDESYRGVRRERFDFVVVAPRPAVALVIEPVGRMLRPRARAPLPSRHAPEFAALIAAPLPQAAQLGARDPRFGDPARRD